MTDEEKLQKIGAAADIDVKITVVAGKTCLTLQQLSDLQIGAILELDKNIDEDLDICVNGTSVAKGRLALSGEELGIYITKILADGDDR